MATVLDLIRHYQNSIDKYFNNNDQKVLKSLTKLYHLPVTVQHLQDTGVGRTVNSLRKDTGQVGTAARSLVAKWKSMVAAEESDNDSDYNSQATVDYRESGRGGCDENVEKSRNNPEPSLKPQDKKQLKSETETYKHTNGHNNSDKRKYQSSEEEEPEPKKSKYSSSSENDDYVRNKDKTNSQSEDTDYSHDDNSDDESGSSEEDVKVKIEKESPHDKTTSRHSSSSNNEGHKLERSSSKHSTVSSDKKSKNDSSDLKNDKKSSTKSSSSHHKSSKKDKISSDTKHKSEQKSTDKDKRHRDESAHGNSSKKDKSHHIDKQKDHSDKHSSKTDKHSSSSHSHKTDKHSQSSEKETANRHKSKDKHSSSSKEKSNEKSSSKDRSRDSQKEKHSSSSSSKSRDGGSKDKHGGSKEKRMNDGSSSSKSSSKSKEIPKKKAHINNVDSDDGIGCESGASFAEALGMISPVKAKKKSTLKDMSSPKFNDLSPSALLSPSAKLAPLPALEISALPDISPNYKPRPPPRLLPQLPHLIDDAVSLVISNKNQRTKVYSGNKVYGKVPSLYELCVTILQEHIDALEFTGGVPYEILKPVVDKATPQQLFSLEHFNPYLMEDTDHLWEKHCQRHFRNKKRMEMETWREMFLRCQEEQEHKLKSLTTNIRIAQEAKKAPIKQTKMAYVDSVVKPPRNIARKQAVHGTARAVAASPAARVASLASAPNVLKSGTSRSASLAAPATPVSLASLNRPKKAPLMQKALQFMRGRKR